MQTGSSTRRGLHAQVVQLLGEQIVLGERRPGDLLDPEAIASELAVSRTVVREALKVLSAKGLLDARPKRGTFVLPRSRWNLLDADVMAWRDAGGLDERLMRELAEVRHAVEPTCARLAAERRDPPQLRELEEAYAEMADAMSVEEHVEADLRFHRAVVSGTENELLNRTQDLLEPALRVRDQRTFSQERGTAHLGAHEAVLVHIRNQSPEEAFGAMRKLILESW